jgi:hypothetical protein
MVESGADIDASYDILGRHGRAEERDEMASLPLFAHHAVQTKKIQSFWRSMELAGRKGNLVTTGKLREWAHEVLGTPGR